MNIINELGRSSAAPVYRLRSQLVPESPPRLDSRADYGTSPAPFRVGLTACGKLPGERAELSLIRETPGRARQLASPTLEGSKDQERGGASIPREVNCG